MVFTWWLRRTQQQLRSAQHAARGTKSRRPVYRPAVEVMEDRVVPASRLFAVPIATAPGAGQIVELNPTTGAVIATLPAPQPATTVGDVGLAFDGTRLFYINGGTDDKLYQLNPNTGAVIATAPVVGGSGGYDGLAVVAGKVYIQDYINNKILVFDPVSNTVVGTLTIAADLAGGLAGASNPGALIATVNGGNAVDEIDPTTGAITHSFQPGFPNLLGAAVVGNDIYLGSGSTNALFHYTRTGTFLNQISTPFRVGALASDDTTPAPGPGGQFVNGNFEAGNVSGWTVFNQQPTGAGSPGFQAYTGPNPFGSQLPAPPQGSFAAIDAHSNPGTYILYQDVALPAGQFHTLSLQAYYNNLAGQFVTPSTLNFTPGPNQQFRIDVISPTADLLSTTTGVLLNVFRTNVGDPNFRAPTTLTADLTPFAGQTVRLRIAVADTINALYSAVDDVKLTSTGTAPTGTVTGVKFNDLNGSGARDAGEPALSGWTIYADLNNNRQRDTGEPFAVTDANGAYTLTVAPGTYTIREVPQPGWVQTAPAADRLFSVRVGNTSAPQIITEYDSNGAVLSTFNGPANVSFQGPQGLAFSGDSLFYIDGEQQPTGSTGVHTLYELDPATGAVLDSDALPATQEIAGLGYLGGLVYVQVHTTNQVLVFDPVTDTVLRTFTVPADIQGGMTGAADLGLLFASNGAGQIFAINPQTGAIVRSFNPGVGPLVGGLGYYHDELIAANAGPTVFRVNPQTGSVIGTINLSGPGGPVAGLAGDGKVGGGQRLSVANNQTITLNFGNQRNEGTVSGVKFNDLNGNGTREGNEPGLSNWTIYADLNNNRQLDAGEPSTVTGSDGSYTLTVPTGTETIREVAQTGWVQTSPLSYTLYSTGANGSQLFTINPATGVATQVGSFGASQAATMATAPDGTLWTIVNPFGGSQAQLARVDPATGLATPIGPLGIVGAAVRALEADAAGTLYAAATNGVLYRLNTTTGAATLIGSFGVPDPVDLAFDPSGALWLVSNSALFRVDTATGAAALVTNITGIGGFFGLSIQPGTGTFYLTTTSSLLFTLDPTTGVATFVGSNQAPMFFGSDFVTDNGHSVTITPGAALSDQDFGNRRNEGTVSGVKYEDLNGNGTRDAGEPGLPGWTIYADANNNGVLDAGEPSAVTGPDGSYQLTVASGSSAIREVPQAGFVQTGPTGDRVYALRSTSTQTLNIYELDSFGFVTNTFPVPAPVNSFGAQGLAVGRNSLFYIDGTPNAGTSRTLYELDPFTGAVIDSDPVNVLGGQVTGLGYLNGLVYLLGAGNQIVAFNPVTDTVVRTLAISGPGLFGGLTGAADLGLLFATAGSQIVAIDPVTGAIVRTLFPNGTGSLLGGLAYRGGELLGVPLTSSPAPIFRIDPFTGAVRGTLAPSGPNTSGLGGDGPHPGAARVSVAPGSALAGRDFGDQRTAAPVAADDSATTNEDTALSVPARGLLANDSGQFGAKAVVAVNGSLAAVGNTILLPSGSLLRVNSDGSYAYAPGANFQSLRAGATATDSFTYTMADGVSATATATVQITILGLNDAPVARGDTFATNEDTAIGDSVLTNDTDVDLGDTVSVIEVNGSAAAVGQTITLASGTRLTVQANGNFFYDPSGAWDQLAAGQTAADGFTYRIADAAGATSSASVTINLIGVNDAPAAVNDTDATDEDTLLTATAPGVLVNDTDVDTGDTISVVAVNGAAVVGQAVTLPSGARLTLRADGSYDYDPTGAFDFLPAGQTALDTIGYTIADAAGATSTAMLTITVSGLNDAIVAVNDSATTDEDTVLNGAAPGVLDNDTDPDSGDTRAVAAVNGDPTAVGQAVTLASGAVVTVYADGSYTYDPNGAFEALGPGQSATDSFTYSVADAAGTTSTATVTVTVTGVNDAPVANPDAFSTDEDMALVVLTGVLANDTDVDGGALSATLRSGPANGMVTVNSDGSFTYTPNHDFNGTDTFTYTVSDGRGGTAVGLVTITVRPVNDAPTLAPATFTIRENSPNGTFVGAAAGADVDDTDLRYRIVSGNTAGAFAIDAATGRLTVANVAALDFETTPTFTLTIEVRDPSGLTATASIVVRLTDVINPPQIDIAPGDPSNRINSRSHGKISVAILSNSEFDARQVDISSLRFGRTGTENSVSQHPNQGPRYHYEDVNGDGRLDLVVEFEVERTGFRPGDARGILTGRLNNGFVFSAADMVFVT